MFTKEIMNRNMNIYYLSGNENYELRYFSLFSMLVNQIMGNKNDK